MTSPIPPTPEDGITVRIQPATWWVWFDRLLDEWFYSPQNPEATPALAAQLKKEKITIHEVQAPSGAQAIELICPGYRSHRQDPVSAPPTTRPRLN